MLEEPPSSLGQPRPDLLDAVDVAVAQGTANSPAISAACTGRVWVGSVQKSTSSSRPLGDAAFRIRSRRATLVSGDQ